MLLSFLEFYLSVCNIERFCMFWLFRRCHIFSWMIQFALRFRFRLWMWPFFVHLLGSIKFFCNRFQKLFISLDIWSICVRFRKRSWLRLVMWSLLLIRFRFIYLNWWSSQEFTFVLIALILFGYVWFISLLIFILRQLDTLSILCAYSISIFVTMYILIFPKSLCIGGYFLFSRW